MNEQERLQRIQTLVAAIAELARSLKSVTVFQLAETAFFLAAQTEHFLVANMSNIEDARRVASKILAEPHTSHFNKSLPETSPSTSQNP